MKIRKLKIDFPPCFMGLDVSMNGTGVAIFNSKGKHLHSEVIIPKKSEQMRLLYETCIPNKKRAKNFFIFDQVVERILSLIEAWQVSGIAIENYAFGIRKSTAVTKLGELGGILRISIVRDGAGWIEVATTSIKKFISGSGSCALTDITLKVFQKWKEDFESILSSKRVDAAIAYGAGLIAYYYFYGPADKSKLLAYEKDVLKQITKKFEKESKDAEKD